VLETVEDDVSGTYRAVYIVKTKNLVHVLHCFQKKSVKGVQAPKNDTDLIRRRLVDAEFDAKETGHG
jgi:phage-related protein